VHLQPNDGVKLVSGYTPESDLRWNVALGLRNADQPLVDAVNDILRHRMADGTIKAIFDRYGVPYYPPFKTEVATKPGAAATDEGAK